MGTTKVVTDGGGVFTFPNPVNEISARLVAGGVVLIVAVILTFSQAWLIIPLAYGFVARTLAGPTFSPLGQLVTRVVTPVLKVNPRMVPGPPKRFAQSVGAVLSVSAVILYFIFGLSSLAFSLVVVVGVAAFLESAFGFCVGCKSFALLMKVGVIPSKICAKCNDLYL